MYLICLENWIPYATSDVHVSQVFDISFFYKTQLPSTKLYKSLLRDYAFQSFLAISILVSSSKICDFNVRLHDLMKMQAQLLRRQCMIWCVDLIGRCSTLICFVIQMKLQVL